MFFRQHHAPAALLWRLLILAVLVSATPSASVAADLVGVRQDGREIAAGDIPGWKLVYFGYTHCPDLCPVSLQSMTLALDALGPIGERITPVFVTVDPERDTSAVIAEYVSYFHPRMIGLSPHPDQLSALAKAWRVKYARVELKEQNSYSVDHTAAIFLADPSGAIVGRYPHDLDGGGLAERIRASMLAR
jgi:protein SCO1/2